MATLTVYPDPHEETSTVDGYVQRDGVDETWATIIAGAGTGANDSGALLYVRIFCSGTTDKWADVRRPILLFDTSSLGAGAIISATILSLYGYLKSDTLSITPDIDIYTSSPGHNTYLAAADYGQVQAVSQTGSPITFGNFSATGYNNFTFNATGRGNISKTGISKFGARNSNYDVSETPPAWTADEGSSFQMYAAERANTTQDPKLVVTYTAAQHYTLTAEAGSYTMAGQDASLRSALKVAAGVGSYSLAGQDASLRVGKKMAADAGSYSLTGQDAVLRAIRRIAAEGGSYTLTGYDANLLLGHHYVLTAEQGYYGEPYEKIFVTLEGRIYKKMGDTYLRLS